MTDLGGGYSSLQFGSVPRNRKLAVLKLVRRIIAGVSPIFTIFFICSILEGYTSFIITVSFRCVGLSFEGISVEKVTDIRTLMFKEISMYFVSVTRIRFVRWILRSKRSSFLTTLTVGLPWVVDCYSLRQQFLCYATQRFTSLFTKVHSCALTSLHFSLYFTTDLYKSYGCISVYICNFISLGFKMFYGTLKWMYTALCHTELRGLKEVTGLIPAAMKYLGLSKNKKFFRT